WPRRSTGLRALSASPLRLGLTFSAAYGAVACAGAKMLRGDATGVRQRLWPDPLWVGIFRSTPGPTSLGRRRRRALLRAWLPLPAHGSRSSDHRPAAKRAGMTF